MSFDIRNLLFNFSQDTVKFIHTHDYCEQYDTLKFMKPVALACKMPSDNIISWSQRR